MNRAGAETLIMNIYRKIDRSRFQFDFLVHTQEESDYDAEILSLGGNIYHIQPFTGLNFFLYKKAVLGHLQAHPEHKVIHIHMTSTAYIIAKQAHKLECRTIIHTHSQNFYSGIQNLCFKAISFPLRFVGDYFLACSREAAIDTFGAEVIKKDCYSLFLNSIDLSLYHTTNKKHHELKNTYGLDNKAIFGHIGRFIPEKNHAFLLQSFCELKKILPNAILLLAGRGPLEKNTKKIAKELKIDDSVIFLGVSNKVPQLLQLMDVFVFPSVKEGLGLAAIEAQAAGATCILSTGVPKIASVVFSTRIPLAWGSKKWAKELAEAYKNSLSIDRSITTSKLANAGYDITDSVNQISALYETMLNYKRTTN